MMHQGIDQPFNESTSNEWGKQRVKGGRTYVCMSERTHLSIIQPINQRTREPIDGYLLKRPLGLSMNGPANEAVNEGPLLLYYMALVIYYIIIYYSIM